MFSMTQNEAAGLEGQSPIIQLCQLLVYCDPKRQIGHKVIGGVNVPRV